MCGIGLHLLNSDCSQDDITSMLKRRGPTVQCSTSYMNCISMIGCVLHIQGDKVACQPAEDNNGNILLWNGEVFGGLSASTVSQSPIPSDTECILSAFDSILQIVPVHEARNAGDLLMKYLSTIDGPYAFIYIYKRFNVVFYGRDPFGRRSLLLVRRPRINETSEFVNGEAGEVIGIVSVAPVLKDKSNYDKFSPVSSTFEEVDIDGIYSLNIENLITNMIQSDASLGVPMLHSWSSSRTRLQRSDIRVRLENSNNIYEPTSSLVLQFYEVLLQALRCRLDVLHTDAPANGPQGNTELSRTPVYGVGVLFSGGIDSVVLAVFLHLALEEKESKYGAKNAIDLINVSFYNSDNIAYANMPSTPTQCPPRTNKNISPDRIAAIVAYGELKRIFPHREWRLVHVDVSGEERQCYTPHIVNLIRPSHTHMDLNIGTAFWFASRGIGYVCDYGEEDILKFVDMKDDAGRPMLRIGEEDAAASVGLSAWKQEQKKRDKRLRQQAKRNFRKGCHKREQNEDGVLEVSAPERNASKKEDCLVEEELTGEDGKIPCSIPECRLVGKSGCIYGMCKRCCIKKINEDSIGATESLYCKSHKVLPRSDKCASFDDSSELILVEEPLVEEKPLDYYPYESKVKVLLIGIGADEQMAGYGRHRTAYVRGGGITADDAGNDGYSELNKELNKDLNRLWQRNLGR